MNLDVLTAISPIDGRYRSKTETLAGYFSEYALIRYRVRVEIEYFITLCELPLPQLADFDQTLFGRLRSIYRDFTVADAQRVKDIEKITNHDVKAVEYFIKEKLTASAPASGTPASAPASGIPASAPASTPASGPVGCGFAAAQSQLWAVGSAVPGGAQHHDAEGQDQRK